MSAPNDASTCCDTVDLPLPLPPATPITNGWKEILFMPNDTGNAAGPTEGGERDAQAGAERLELRRQAIEVLRNCSTSCSSWATRLALLRRADGARMADRRLALRQRFRAAQQVAIARLFRAGGHGQLGHQRRILVVELQARLHFRHRLEFMHAAAAAADLAGRLQAARSIRIVQDGQLVLLERPLDAHAVLLATRAPACVMPLTNLRCIKRCSTS